MIGTVRVIESRIIIIILIVEGAISIITVTWGVDTVGIVEILLHLIIPIGVEEKPIIKANLLRSGPYCSTPMATIMELIVVKRKLNVVVSRHPHGRYETAESIRSTQTNRIT